MSNTGSGTRRHPALLAMYVTLSALCASSAYAKCKPGKALEPGDHVFNLDFGGKSRTFTLHIPPMYDGRTALPLVFDLHGFSSNGPQQLNLSGFKAVSDMNGFIVVAPTGYMNSWNGDIAYGAAYMAGLDDVGLMKELVRYIAGIANINRGKVYATGLSNGAAMSNTLGCQAADTFAAVAPVADPLDIGLATCKPARPISVLGFHGYDDEYVPYEGGPGSGPALPTPFPSIPDTLKNWAMVMGCTGSAEVVTIQGKNKCEIYRECSGDAEVGYCSLEGGHVLYQQNVLNIADYAWKFFEKFSLPLPDADGDHIGDEDDNCVNVANPDQKDSNGNCVGDACECATQADCDDGAFCNGSEACTNGVCDHGMEPCAASQKCDESARQCVEAATKPAAGSAQAGMAGDMSRATAGTAAAGQAAIAGTAATPSANAGLAATGGSANPEASASGGAMQPSVPERRHSSGCSAAGSESAGPRGLLLPLALALVRLRRKREPIRGCP
jgi:polyhydroxybutyrate depolymerase